MACGKLVNIHAHLHTTQDVSATVRQWTADGVVKTCVLAEPSFWMPPNSTYMGNADVLKWRREFPDAIVGMGAVELGQNMGCPDDIRRLKDEGFEGLKFDMPSHPYDHDRYFPLYAAAEELHMPILFHTGYVARLEVSDRRCHPSSDYMRPFRLDRIARAFPNLPLIGAHLGLPHGHEALALLSLPNVYYDISGGGGQKPHLSKLKKALAPFPGADWDNPQENLALEQFKKLVFGTDNPPVSVWYPASEEILNYLHIPGETRELFYWKTAAAIFGWTGL
ncbi:MAG: hypothetical protein A3K19_32525 [Lentisphaerae bacterium RIFOXYB12_FULL_65_16]|nr:MAG: hypothetical protein A3K18_08040 [Lentisphaerae bacterium RIFOXYA12_64_32]OGV84423.1 MAG: hypothetical protein A3K19_32525 [Lentisphaerae bacterium RIFOXYB12_FULL_65_16]